MADRVGIFIDGSNLYHGLKNHLRRQDLNFTSFIAKLCGSRTLFRTYYYNVLQDPDRWPATHREQQDFLDVLHKTPYLEVRLGSTKVAQGVPVERGIDIMLATDLVTYAIHDFYDVAILVSGDADFIYAIQAIKNMGKHVEVAYFETAISRDLLDIADNSHLLNHNFFKGLWANERRYSGRKRTFHHSRQHIEQNNA